MNEQQKKPSRGMPPAEPVVGMNLIGYQEASVVSREILKRNNGNVTLFAFDAGQGLSEHTSPFDALAHLLEGDAEIVIAGKPLRAKAGDLVLDLPPKVRQPVKAHNSLNGGMSHGIVSQAIHEGVQVGGHRTAGARGFAGGGGTGTGSEPERIAALEA